MSVNINKDIENANTGSLALGAVFGVETTNAGNGSAANGSTDVNGADLFDRMRVDDVIQLVDSLHFGHKVERSLDLINDA